LYTALDDLERIISNPLVQGDWIDLGAGVGLSALVFGYLLPHRRALGIEFEAPRVAEGQRIKRLLNLENVDLRCDDLLSCEIPVAQNYFLYFPTGPVLDRVLCVLRNMPGPFRIIAIESHGDLIPRLKKESWLQVTGAVPLTASQRHHPEALIFDALDERSTTGGPHDLSWRKQHLLIEDRDGRRWWGESEGLQWLRGEEYQLVTPPRTICWDQVKAVGGLHELPTDLQRLIELRKKSPQLQIRKIFCDPSLALELADGSLCEPVGLKLDTV
jgi:hypothetical protein